jgi:TPR repeat protein
MQSHSSIEEAAHEAWDAGNLRVAFSLFTECVKTGSVGCIVNLGYFYDEGLGVKQDKGRAMYWYKRAYRQGEGAAASNIAILYREAGRRALTYQWLCRAADLGDGDAEVEVAKLLAAGIGVRRSVPFALAALKRARRSRNITPGGREEAAKVAASLRSAA